MKQQKNLLYGGEVVELDKILERSWIEKLIATSETRLREEHRDAENRHNATCLRIERKLDDSVKRLEQKLDDSIARLDEKIDKLETKIESRFEKIDEQFEKVNERFEKVDEKFEKVDERFKKVDEKLERVFERLDAIARWCVGLIVAMVVGFSSIIATLAIAL